MFVAAIYMTSQIENAQGSMHLRVEPIRSSYFRSALAELIRVEDISKESGARFMFCETDDPLLHIVKLMRNYEVHIATHEIKAGGVLVRYDNQEGVYESFIVSNLSANQLRKLRSAECYSDTQLEELVNLFDLHQRKFGVVQLLFNTCLHVCKLLQKPT